MRSTHFIVCDSPKGGTPKGTTRACGGKKPYTCPEVDVARQWVTITDDFGGKVRMSRRQFRLLLSMSRERFSHR